MEETNRHIIERISLDVTTERGGYATQQAYGDWLRSVAVPAMTTVCDELLPADRRCQLERLDLDLGHFPVLDPELPQHRSWLLERLLAQLRTHLEDHLAVRAATPFRPKGKFGGRPNSRAEKLPTDHGERPFAAWLFFLEHGYLPWWAEVLPPPEHWSERLTEYLRGPKGEVARKRLLVLVETRPAALVRLVSDRRHFRALSALTKEKTFWYAAFSHWEAAGPDCLPILREVRERPVRPEEWITAGRAYWWLRVLGQGRTTDNREVILERMLVAAFPDFAEWPRSVRNGLRQRLGVTQRDGADFADKATATVEGKETTGGTKEKRSVDDDPNARSPRGEKDKREKRFPEQEADHRNPSPNKEPSFGGAGQSPGADEITLGAKGALLAPENKNPEIVRTVQPTEGRPLLPPPLLPGTSTAPIPSPAPAAARPISAPPTGTYWYVNHAGVVLAHPFLDPLFTALGYRQEGEFVDPVVHQRAVFLTHFLATGERDGHEEDLLLAKLLCGWPLTDAPVRLTEALTDPECTEADAVLTSIIEHWTAIGPASPEGLREGFFAREGRLERLENGWRVTVARKAQDILLGQLPWGISVVRAPWREGVVKVVW